MSRSIVRASAGVMPLADESVDLIFFSPPYFGLRSYRDGGEHYEGQIGDEPTPQDFLESLWAVMAECWRVLKRNGSCVVNIGDKRSGSGGHNNSNITGSQAELGPQPEVVELGDRHLNGAPARRGRGTRVTRAPRVVSTRNAPKYYNREANGIRAKSKMLLPHRFAIGCEDGLADPLGIGWIVRQDMIWLKPGGMPESVTDRTRDNFEYLFHLTKEGDYYANLDELREPLTTPAKYDYERGNKRHVPETGGEDQRINRSEPWSSNSLGRLAGSIWPINTEPLVISPEVIAHYDLPKHFAAFPQELARRVISGFSPTGICTACGEGRHPVVVKTKVPLRPGDRPGANALNDEAAHGPDARAGHVMTTREIVGEACACTPRTRRDPDSVADWREGREAVPEQMADDWHAPGGRTPRRQGSLAPTNYHTEDSEHRIGPSGKQHAPENYPERPPLWEYHLEGWTPPPTRPAVVLDPFAGTGTTVGVADVLGRIGIGLDLSFDYCRLARWRLERSGHFAKTHERMWAERQTVMDFG